MADKQTQNTAEAQQITVDDLSNKIKETTNELNQLKSWLNNLSLEEQNDKLSDIENAILECSEDLATLEKDGSSTISKTQLNTLKTQINTLTSAKESLQKQIEAQTKKEIDNLKWNIAQAQDNWENQEWDKKSWLWRQRSWLTSKEEWKNHTGKNILRLAWWVWIAAWIRKLWKRIFGGKDKKESWAEAWKSRRLLRKERREQRRKERRERRANRPWWQKFLIWSAIAGGTVVWWVQIYKNWNRITSWFKEKLWLSLSFDEAMYSVETEVKNWINKDTNFWNMCAHFYWMSFDENTQEVCSFGEKVKINKKNKTIEWMDDIQFASREELLHAVNIINFAKRNLKWMWSNNTPFILNKQTWDIDFSMTEAGKTNFITANWSNFWTEVLWLWWGGIWSILWLYFFGLKWLLIWWVWAWLAWYTIWSLIDNKSSMWRMCSTIAKGANLQKFIKYLNEQSIWWQQEEQYEPDDKTPMQKYFNEVMKDINEGYSSWADYSAIRNPKLERDESQPSVYKIKTYYQEVKLNLEWCTAKKWEEIDFTKITKISILNYEKSSTDPTSPTEESFWKGLNIEFPKTEDGLREAIRTANLTNKIRQDWKNNCDTKYPFDYWKYKLPFSFEVDSAWAWTNYMWWTTILNQNILKNKYPTLYQDLRKFPTVLSLWWENFQEKMNTQAVKDESTWSQYIKYLHQMWKWNYWKKI